MSIRVPLTRIISGGQTGADQGALMAAGDLGVPTGGTAPGGWQTETGPQEQLLKSYGLEECSERGYDARTRINVRIADGTLIVGPYEEGGTALTVRFATEAAKPAFFVPFDLEEGKRSAGAFLAWLDQYRVRVLNVAGARESRCPGLQEFTRAFLVTALRKE